MKSLYSHLESVKAIGEKINPKYKPVFRSSAIFPVLHNKKFSSRILFMGYWLLKRNIKEIGLLMTLRSHEGVVIERQQLIIDSGKSFRINISDFDITNDDFVGSLELEIFSSRDLVFPYPAFVISYYSDTFESFVHTTGRIYNDIEDVISNEEYKVNESGFDIFTNSESSPFLTFTNGPLASKEIKVEFTIKSKSYKKKGVFELGDIKPYETKIVEFKNYIELTEFHNQKATISISHNFQGFFPRFIVGNFNLENNSISITHSYYDSSNLSDNNSYWNRLDERFIDASVMIPYYHGNNLYTELAIYPIFSPSDYYINFNFYNTDGNLIFQKNKYKKIESKNEEYSLINLNEIVLENNWSNDQIAGILVSCKFENSEKVPTRIKYGLNIGFSSKQNRLPCNICFAPLLGNPKLLNKVSSFRWAPLSHPKHSELLITNSPNLINFDIPANIKVTFYREWDEEVLARDYILNPNGLIKISPQNDKTLTEFMSGGTCWATINADSPFINGWYFYIDRENLNVGGDHVF